jgi:hypothetical protein
LVLQAVLKGLRQLEISGVMNSLANTPWKYPPSALAQIVSGPVNCAAIVDFVEPTLACQSVREA